MGGGKGGGRVERLDRVERCEHGGVGLDRADRLECGQVVRAAGWAVHRVDGEGSIRQRA